METRSIPPFDSTAKTYSQTISTPNKLSSIAEGIITNGDLATFGFDNKIYGMWDAFVSSISQLVFKLGIIFLSNRDEGKLTAAKRAVNAFQEVMKKGEEKQIVEASLHLNEIYTKISEKNVRQELFNSLLLLADAPHAKEINEELRLLHSINTSLDKIISKKEFFLANPDFFSNARMLKDYQTINEKPDNEKKELEAKIALRAFKIIQRNMIKEIRNTNELERNKNIEKYKDDDISIKEEINTIFKRKDKEETAINEQNLQLAQSLEENGSAEEINKLLKNKDFLKTPVENIETITSQLDKVKSQKLEQSA